MRPRDDPCEKLANLSASSCRSSASLVAIVLLWNRAVDWIDLAIFAVMYIAVGFGVTIGFHRLLTHRAFQTSKPLEYRWAILGSMSVQGSVMDWVADHRKHHAHTDQEGDPHSPHVGHGHGLRGLVHAHIGWLFNEQGQADWKKYAPRPLRGPDDAPHRPQVPAAGRCSAWSSPRVAGWPAARQLRGRAARPRVGRPRARVLPAPRHVVDQLGLPLLRAPALRHRGPLDQRGLARAAVARRGVAPQPPRVPALGAARPEALGARWIRPRGSSAAWSGSASPGTSCASRPSARQQKLAASGQDRDELATAA